MPPLRVRIYDIPIMNAFALPGGHIVLTRGLLREAYRTRTKWRGFWPMRLAMWRTIIRRRK